MFRLTRRRALPLALPLLLTLALFAATLTPTPAAAFGNRLRSLHSPNFPPLNSDQAYSAWKAFDGMLFFTVRTGFNRSSLWRSAGTPESTLLLKEFPTGLVELGEPLGGALLFFAPGADGSLDLWRSAGAPETTELVTDLLAGPGNVTMPIKVLGTRLIFQAPVEDGSVKLWRSDGTPSGTAPLPASTAPNFYTPLAEVGASLLYFGGPSGDVELWKTDGTEAGSGRVKDINPSGSSLFDQAGIRGMFYSTGRKVYFGATDGVNGVELWQSDGTTAGTTMVKDLFPGTASSQQLSFVGNLGDTVLFSNHAASSLWRTDGTAAGTYELLADDFGLHEKALLFNDALYFTAFTGSYQTELWRSDGTVAGTQLVKDINPGTGTFGGSWPRNLTVFNGKLYFTTCDINERSGPGGSFNGTGAGLYATDGTSAGTVMVVQGRLNLSCSASLTVAGDTIFYQNSLGQYVGNGTPAGMRPLELGANQELKEVNLALGNAYFLSVDTRGQDFNISGSSFWRSDGTAAGTSQILPDLHVSESIQVGDTVYFYGRRFRGNGEFFAAPLPDLLSVRGAVTASGGGTLRSLDGQVAVSFGPGAVAGDVTVELRPLSRPGQSTGSWKAVRSFTLEAVDGAGQVVTSFQQPYTLTVAYVDDEIADMAEGSLNLAFWNGSNWAALLPCAGCSHDRGTNMITVKLDHFTEFALLGTAPQRVYLPAVTKR